jgi:hypothetical protein
MPKLTTLDISNNWFLTNNSLINVGTLTSLQLLNLDNCFKLNDDCFRYLQTLTSLTSLKFSVSQRYFIGLEEARLSILPLDI